MKDKILAIINKIGTVNGGWTEWGWRVQYTKEDAAKDIDALYQKELPEDEDINDWETDTN